MVRFLETRTLGCFPSLNIIQQSPIGAPYAVLLVKLAVGVGIGNNQTSRSAFDDEDSRVHA